MRIAVTGGVGFIGTELVSRLLDRGDEVTVVDHWQTRVNEYELNRYPITERVYRNLAAASQVLTPDEFITSLPSRGGYHAVVHLGAIVDTTDLGSSALFEMNVSYTRSLVKALASTTRLIFGSSAAVYGSRHVPNNPYGLSKAIAEQVVRAHRNHVILRFFNVFGRDEHHKKSMASMPFKISETYRGGSLKMHSPDAERDFVPVSLVTERIIKHVTPKIPSMLANETSLVEDVGTGHPMSFRDLEYFVRKAMGFESSRVDLIEMPKELVGRYQGYTCASPGLGDEHTTRDAIQEYYGRPK